VSVQVFLLAQNLFYKRGRIILNSVTLLPNTIVWVLHSLQR